jgi:O-antigen/teichoic acid export membrane protein
VLFLTTAGSMFIGLMAHAVGFIVMARSLGSYEVGLLAVITTACSLGAVWSDLGAGEIARRRMARDPAIESEVVGHGLICILVLGSLISLILMAGLLLFIPLDAGLWTKIWVLFLLVPSNVILFALISYIESVFLARNEFRTANLINLSFGVGRAVTATVACIGFGVTTMESWAVWHFAFYVMAALPCLILLWRASRPKFAILWEEVPRGASVSVSCFVVAMRGNADILALSAVTSPAVVGVYSVARRVIGMAVAAGCAMDRIVYARLAIAGSGGATASIDLARKYAIYAVGITGAVALALFAVAPLLPFVVGAQYATAVPMVRALCWILVPVALANLAADTLNASENHALRLLSTSVAAVLGSVLIFECALTYGVGGAVLGVYVTELGVAHVGRRCFGPRRGRHAK